MSLTHQSPPWREVWNQAGEGWESTLEHTWGEQRLIGLPRSTGRAQLLVTYSKVWQSWRIQEWIFDKNRRGPRSYTERAQNEVWAIVGWLELWPTLVWPHATRPHDPGIWLGVEQTCISKVLKQIIPSTRLKRFSPSELYDPPRLNCIWECHQRKR